MYSDRFKPKYEDDDYRGLRSHPALRDILFAAQNGQTSKLKELQQMLVEDYEYYGELYGSTVYIEVENSSELIINYSNGDPCIRGLDIDTLRENGFIPHHVRLRYDSSDREYKVQFKCILYSVENFDGELNYVFYIDPIGDARPETRIVIYSPVEKTNLSFQRDEFHFLHEGIVSILQQEVQGKSRLQLGNLQKFLTENVNQDTAHYLDRLEEIIRTLRPEEFTLSAWFALEQYIFRSCFIDGIPYYIDASQYHKMDEDGEWKGYINEMDSFLFEGLPEGILLMHEKDRFIPYLAFFHFDNDSDTVVHIPLKKINEIDTLF